MDREFRRQLDAFRRDDAGPIENNLIDELAGGELDRAEFIRRGTVFGVSASVIGAALRVFGDAPLARAAAAAPVVGGRLRLGINPPPTKGLDPYTYADVGGLATGGVAGEFLVRSALGLTLRPELATSWKPNKDASVWTFKLRPGVMFQSGQMMTADDVVATYKRLVDPNSGSQALSAFKGSLSPDGVGKVDNLTVEFRLDAPTASFPYLASSTTYQAIILPASYQPGTFEKVPQATGAFKLVSYTPGVGARFDRFAGWWGGHPPLDGVDVTYFSDDAAEVAGLLAGQLDLGNVSFATARPLLNSGRTQIFASRSSTHREVPMRTDLHNPLRDWRVRQAIALTLDRPAIVKTLFSKYADVGNDSPFAPVFPSTNTDVPQRKKNLRLAMQLMEAAGYRNGFSITLTTESVGEIPQLAQIIQRSVRPLGIKMTLKILTSTAYFAGSQTGPPAGWGTTPWLNAPVTITDWGNRPVPNVFLTAALKSHGVWNAAHYARRKFDRLADAYIAAVAISDQRKIAGQIERLLLHDTPVLFPYFYNVLDAGSKRVRGYQVSPIGQFYLSKTSLA
jgi:peptide/nickel transport system substrate-binding protein